MATAAAESVRFDSTVEMVAERLIARLPARASKQLPSRGQVAVRGTINDRAFATVLEPDGRFGHWIRIDDRVRKSARLHAGDTVSLDVTTTKEWPEPDVPKDLAAALRAAPQMIRDIWADITPMARWEWVRWVNATRNPDTRARRVEVTILKMKNGKRRPCCFDLSSCTDPDLARSGKLVDPARSRA